MFGQLTEEALFGEQFDQLRKAEASNNNTASGSSSDSVAAGGNGKVSDRLSISMMGDDDLKEEGRAKNKTKSAVAAFRK